MQGLITEFEVLEYSPAGRDYPTTHICSNKLAIQEGLMNKCFGEDFWNYMVDSLTPYPTNAVEWVPATTYAADDYVIRDGCLYKSLEDGNSTDPLLDTVKWQAFEKFTKTCLNTFWVSYLRPYLAYRIYANSLLYTTHKSGAGGLVIRDSDRSSNTGSRTATKAEISNTHSQLLSDSQLIYDNMKVWLKNNKDECDFPAIKIFEDCGGSDCGTRRSKRRWAFQT